MRAALKVIVIKTLRHEEQNDGSKSNMSKKASIDLILPIFPLKRLQQIGMNSALPSFASMLVFIFISIYVFLFSNVALSSSDLHASESKLEEGSKKLKICLTGSTEQTIPYYGEAFVNGARLAVDELDQKQKNKVEIEVHYYDVKPLAALSKLEEMRQSSCHAIVGFSTGNDLLAIEDDLRKDPVLVMSIYGDPNPRFEKTRYLRTMQPAADILLAELLERIPRKIKKSNNVLVVTADDRSEMVAYRDALNKLMPSQKFEHVSVIEQTHDISSVTQVMQRSDSAWDYVFLFTRSLIAAKVTDLIHSKQLLGQDSQKTIFLGTKYFGSAELPAYLNFLESKDVEAYFVRQNCLCNKNKNVEDFIGKYKSKFMNVPMLISIDSYDAVKYLLSSIDKLDSYSSKSVIDYFYKSAQGYKAVGSTEIKRGLKINSTQNFLMKVSKKGYEVIQ